MSCCRWPAKHHALTAFSGAIAALKDRTGSSKHAIVKYLEDTEGVELVNGAVNRCVSQTCLHTKRWPMSQANDACALPHHFSALAKGLADEVLTTARGHGGSYTLTPASEFATSAVVLCLAAGRSGVTLLPFQTLHFAPTRPPSARAAFNKKAAAAKKAAATKKPAAKKAPAKKAPSKKADAGKKTGAKKTGAKKAGASKEGA